MRYHMPHLQMPGHDFVIKIEHLFCDKRFWAAVAITLLVAGFLALLIWAGQNQGAGTEPPLNIPPFPYVP